MRTRVGMWGGSCAIRLPAMAVKTLGLREGEAVDLQIEQGALVVRRGRPRYDLEDLVAQARGLAAPAALDDGPMGDEAL